MPIPKDDTEEVCDMTRGRRIFRALKKYKWYYNGTKTEQSDVELSQQNASRKGSVLTIAPFMDKGQPSLVEAWDYFEYFILPRYDLEEDIKLDTFWAQLKEFVWPQNVYNTADRGTSDVETRLYSPLLTPGSQMGDFGIGVGLYFTTVRYVMIIMFIAGCISIPNFLYYYSDVYSEGQPGLSLFEQPLKGSALCTDATWEPCPTCSVENFENLARLGYSNSTVDDTKEASDGTLMFALRNNCDGGKFIPGMLNLTCLIFVWMSFLLLHRLLKAEAVIFDEDEQTGSDYTLMVNNPPKDGIHTDEWSNFFNQFELAHVTVCTISLENDLLVRYLVKRRDCLMKMMLLLPPSSPMDIINLSRIAAEVEFSRTTLKRIFLAIAHPLGVGHHMPELYSDFSVFNAKIRGLSQRRYGATKIFITFETEEGQRNALTALTVGRMSVLSQNKNCLPKEHLFRGEHVLDIVEPDDPSSIRWGELNVTFVVGCQKMAMTFTLCIIITFALEVGVYMLKDWENVSYVISFLNTAFPKIAEVLTSFEIHALESNRETSLFVKIAVFRVCNSVIIPYMTTHFTATLNEGQDGLLYYVWSIFLSDIIISNCIQLSDPMGHLNRHYFAPRALSQAAMNNKFKGATYSLAERYTNLAKIIFMACFYCSIYPATFILAAMALLINYWADKFSIMRTWAPAPKMGSAIAFFNSKFILPLACLIFAMSSAYLYSGFPFDNMCATDVDVSDYIGDHTVSENDSGAVYDQIQVTAETIVYKHCFQNLASAASEDITFPPLPNSEGDDQWMTEEQEALVRIYAWTFLGMMIVIGFRFVSQFVRGLVDSCKGDYEASGMDMGLNFSDSAATAYIPEVRSPLWLYPLIACETGDVHEDLFEWTDPLRAHECYALPSDAEQLLAGMNVQSEDSAIFDKVKHFPPPYKKDVGHVPMKKQAITNLELRNSLGL